MNLSHTFSRLKKIRALVVGDFILDTYTRGKARRISPEAPVAVVNVQHEEHRSGGAGNVVLNLLSLGAEVVAMGRVGNDEAGKLICEHLIAEGACVDGIAAQHGFPTPVKNRIISDNQQIVRVDREQCMPLPELFEQQLIDQIPVLLQDVDVVALSDYGKGGLSRTLLSAVIEGAQKRNIPIVADPKGTQFSKYHGVTVLKPNFGEAVAAAALPSESSLEQIGQKVLQLSGAEVLMITRSEEGISLFYPDGERRDFAVRAREVKDVTGAGDTVLAMVAFAMGNGLSIEEGAQLSNIAAGIVIEHFGCARVTLGELAKRLLQENANNKVFDEAHLFVLKETLKGQLVSLVIIDNTEKLATTDYHFIQTLSRRPGWHVIVYIRHPNPPSAFVDMLASMSDVDFIVLKGDGFAHLSDAIELQECYLLGDTKKIFSFDQLLNSLN